jgi:hypothetical protein
MTLRKYIAALNALAKEDPKALEYTVVTASDDEGNSYDEVNFGPAVGQYESWEMTFPDGEDDEDLKLNAVCVN